MNVLSLIRANFATGLVVTSTVLITSTAAVRLAYATPSVSEPERSSEVSEGGSIFGVDTTNIEPTLPLESPTPKAVLPQSGCVVTIFGKRYNITTLVNSHSGGNVFTCGADMTASYRSRHGTDVSRMNRYLINSNGSVGSSSSNVANNTGVGGQSLDLTSLALHNKAGDCYIAYNGVVYNVSNHPSWSGCGHHGIQGGTDITSKFPHSTSYLSSLPVVGRLVGGSTTGGGNNNGNFNDDDYETDNYED